MLYKPFRSSLNNSILYGGEKSRKENYYSARKINSWHITRKPTAGSVQGDLARLFLLAGRVDGLSPINEGTRMVGHLSKNSVLTEICMSINHPKISLFSLHIVPSVGFYRAE